METTTYGQMTSTQRSDERRKLVQEEIDLTIEIQAHGMRIRDLEDSRGFDPMAGIAPYLELAREAQNERDLFDTLCMRRHVIHAKICEIDNVEWDISIAKFHEQQREKMRAYLASLAVKGQAAENGDNGGGH